MNNFNKLVKKELKKIIGYGQKTSCSFLLVLEKASEVIFVFFFTPNAVGNIDLKGSSISSSEALSSSFSLDNDELGFFPNDDGKYLDNSSFFGYF